ncbi:MAG TPA: alpha/beta hydrolase [Usitatibacter sp.]|nr:alpha/beta hydrolase [Usitatibacter sp.]
MSPPNLFLLPGLLEDAGGFHQVIDALRDIASCTVADLTQSDTIAGMATDALRQAPEGPLLLAGHSMGGYVALEIARQAPERLAKLALLNTNARADSPESIENRRRLMAMADRDFDGVVNTLLPKLMTEEHLQDPVRTGIIGSMKMAIGKEAFKRQETAIMARVDSRPHLAAIRCPTLVIAGRKDAVMPVELLEELARGIPGARLEILEDCGHMAAIEKPAEVTRLLREWITGRAQPADEGSTQSLPKGLA